MTDLGRRLAALESAGAGPEGPHCVVVIYEPAEGADAAVRRRYGNAPPSMVIVLPNNHRDPHSPHPTAPRGMKPRGD